MDARNELLLSAIKFAGYKTQVEFACAAGIGVVELNSLVKMRVSPLTCRGEFSTSAKIIMEALGACPSDLWTDEQMIIHLNESASDMLVSMVDIKIKIRNSGCDANDDSFYELPDDAAEKAVIRSGVNKLLNVLSERHREVIFGRFYKDKTLCQIGAEIGVSKDRVRVNEFDAIRALRKMPFVESFVE